MKRKTFKPDTIGFADNKKWILGDNLITAGYITVMIGIISFVAGTTCKDKALTLFTACNQEIADKTAELYDNVTQINK